MKIVTIAYQDTTAEINLSRGANCISLKNAKYGVSVLREPDYTKELDNPYLYGMPVLFPVNRISGGEFTFEGRSYRFPVNEPATGCHLHGFLHQAEFSLIEQGESFVKCRYDSDGLYGYFPHQFRVEISYTLTGEGLLQETCISNLSGTNMPVFLGFHTTFQLPFAEGSSAQNVRIFAEVGDEIERNMENYLPTGRILPEDDITRQFRAGSFSPTEHAISRHYKAAGEGNIALYDLAKKVKIVYHNEESFGWRLFYNGGSREFLCLEPQTCMANCQNADFDRDYAGFAYLPPGTSKCYRSQISVEEMDV